MSATQMYRPKEAPAPEVLKNTITVPPPVKREEKGKPPVLKILMGLSVAVLMIFMLIFIFTSMGRTPNPMMMMMYMMMVVGMLTGLFSAFSQVIGSSSAEVDSKRRGVDEQLDIAAEDVADAGISQHNAAIYHHPNPRNIRWLVQKEHPSFWSGDVTESVARDTFRIGVGVAQLQAPLATGADADGELEYTEQFETYTARSTSLFKSVQSAVPEIPIARTLDHIAYGFRGGDQEAINGLVRSMVLSGAFKYSPNRMLVGVIAKDDSEWGWVKWLPHAKNRLTAPGRSGYKQLAWRSFAEFIEKFSPYFASLEATGTRLYVIVDDPNLALRLPQDYPSIAGVTFLAANVYSDEAVTNKNHRFRLNDGRLYMKVRKDIQSMRADHLSRFDAELTARAMAPIRPEGFYSVVEAAEATEAAAGGGAVDNDDPEKVKIDLSEMPTVLEALGIGDIDTFDLKREVWDKNEYKHTLESMIGYELTERNQPNGEIATLNIYELAGNGTGPHGLLQGGTGTGKSHLLTALVLGMILKYSPSKLNLILKDFKGGVTWKSFRDLPHVLAIISNLTKATEMLDRAEAVIKGELIRRQEMLDKYEDVTDIAQYRARYRLNPDMEPMPYLLIVVDEGAKFLKENPQYRGVYAEVSQQGRSLGVHLLLSSQTIEKSAIGDETAAEATYGLSLKVKSETASATVLGTNRSAPQLPAGKVALLWKSVLQDSVYQRVTAYNWTAKYLRPVQTAEEAAHQIAPAPTEDTSPSSSGRHTAARRVLTGGTDMVGDFDLFYSPEGFKRVDDTAPEVDEPAPLEIASRPGTFEETGLTILQAGLQLVRKYGQGYSPRQLWLESLSYPVSFSHFGGDFTPPRGNGICLRLGDTDQPFNHRRVPLVYTFDRSHGLMAITGKAGAGATNTVRALIATSARLYNSRQVSWMVYDFRSNDLACMETWPNVCAYANQFDEDAANRVRGEFTRIVQLRARVMAEHKMRSLDEYFDKRASLGVNDAYGYIFIAIDGFDTLIESYVGDGSFANYTTERNWWAALFEKSAATGCYGVITARDQGTKHTAVTDAATMKVFLAQGGTVMLGDSSPEVRAAVRALPVARPGSTVDLSYTTSTGGVDPYQARVLVPIDRKIEPDGEDGGMPYFDLHDYTAEIEELGRAERAAKTADELAVEVQTVPDLVSYSVVSQAYMDPRWRELSVAHRHLPVGINRGTYEPVAVDLWATPNVFVMGTGRAGVSSTMRTLINSVTAMYTPEEAGFIILDGRMGLIDMRETLVERGYMKSSSYALNANMAKPLVSAILQDMIARQPDNLDTLTSAQIADRSFVTRRELFVVVDGFDNLRAKQPGLTEGTLEWLAMHAPKQNLGVHFLVGTDSTGIGNWMGLNKFTRMMSEEVASQRIMLRGKPSEGRIFGGESVKFKDFVQPGRAIWQRSNEPADTLVQVAHSEPMKD